MTKQKTRVVNEQTGALVDDDSAVIDDAEFDETVSPDSYDISSYGADYDVEGIVRRLERQDILVPDFQRNYVWNQQEASRFVESLLLGLPVPGVFVAREQESNKLLVIDGQQRLKTLEFFYKGFFNPKKEDKKRKVFSLVKVQESFEGLTYSTLRESDRVKLDNSIIHATVVKQESPKDDDTSIYHIFERLNHGGRKINAQEIRTALYHGSIIDLVKDLNNVPEWRSIYGKKSNRLKDQELILRFLTLYFSEKPYQAPMEEFINKFTKVNQFANSSFLLKARTAFTNTIQIVWRNLNGRAFRPERALNAAVFDSVMVGLAHRVVTKKAINATKFTDAYAKLLNDPDYIFSTSRATSNEANVSTRIKRATKIFQSI